MDDCFVANAAVVVDLHAMLGTMQVVTCLAHMIL